MMGSWFDKFLPFRSARKSGDRPRKRKPSRRRGPFLQLEELETRVVPANVLWTGAAGDLSWNDHANWSTGAIPGNGDDVSIAANKAVYFSSGNAAIRSVTGGGNLNITGGTLAVGQASNLNMLTVSAGTAEFDGSLQLTALIQTGGTFTGSGAVTVSGPANWSGGTMSGSGSTTLQGPFVLGGADSNAHAETLNGRALFVQGPMSESGSGTLNTVNQPDLVLPPSAPLSVPTAPGSYTISYQDAIVNGLDPILTRTYSGGTLVSLTAQVDNADGSSTSDEWDYNSDGSPSEVDETLTKADGSSTISVWNYSSGGTPAQVVQSINGDGPSVLVLWEYTSDGSLAQIVSTTTNADYSVTTYTWSYNAGGILSSVAETVTHPDGSGTSDSWSYASDGTTLTEVTHALTNADGSRASYDWTYNSDGVTLAHAFQTIFSTDGSSISYAWTYDGAESLTELGETIINADGSGSGYAWDYASDGTPSDVQMITFNADHSNTQYGWIYNSDGSWYSVTEIIVDGNGSATSYEWSEYSDGKWNSVREITPNGTSSYISYYWDYSDDGSLGVTKEISNVDGSSTTYQWFKNSQGGLDSFYEDFVNADQSGTIYSWMYNSDGSTEVTKSITNADSTSTGYDWQFDSDGNPINITEGTGAADGSSTSLNWIYTTGGNLESVFKYTRNADGSTTSQAVWPDENGDDPPVAPVAPQVPSLSSTPPDVPADPPVAPKAPSISPQAAPDAPDSPPDVPPVPAAPTDYVLVTTPSNVTVGTPFDVTATVYTTLDNTIDTTYTGNVMIALANDPNGDTSLGGTTTIKIDDGSGVADFGNLTLNEPGLGFTLQVSGENLSPATTNPFDVAGDHLVVMVQPPASVAADEPFDVQVVAEDVNNKVDADFAGSVDLAFANDPNGNSVLGGTHPQNAENGVVQFSFLTVDKSGQGFVLQATSDGQEPATTNAFDVTAVLRAPSIDLDLLPFSAQIGAQYNLWAHVTNNASVTLPIDINWKESWQGDALQLPHEPDFPSNGALSVTLQPGETKDVLLDSFTRTWDWIPPTNPTKTVDQTLTDFYQALNQALLEGTKNAWQDTITPLLGLGATKLISGLDAVLPVVLGPQVAFPSNTFSYGATASAQLDGQTAETQAAPESITLQVPISNQASYYGYVGSNIAAGMATETGIGLIVGSTIVGGPAGGALAALADAGTFFAYEIAQLLVADALYTQAKDPPDPNYTTLATLQPLDIPELASVPSGFFKDMANSSLSLEAAIAAESASRDRSEGAQQAGDSGWQATQLIASSDFALQAAELAGSLAASQSILEPGIRTLLAPYGGDIITYLENNSLPDMEVRALQQAGWSPDNIETLRQNLIDLGPDALTRPELGTIGLTLTSFSSAYSAIQDLETAILVRTTQLGMSKRDLTLEELDSVNAARAQIETALAQGVPSPQLLADIQSYTSQVRSLLLDSNNLDALGADLDFAYTALESFGMAEVTPGNLTQLLPPTASINPVAETTYDGLPHGTTGQVVGFIGETLSNTVVYTDSRGNQLAGPPINAGTYTATISYPGDNNYLPAFASTTIKIDQAKAIITYVTDGSINPTIVNDGQPHHYDPIPYDRNPHIVTGSVQGVPGETADLNPLLSPLVDGGADAGVYIFGWLFQGNNDYLPDNGNYVLDITPKPLTVTATDKSMTYGGTVPALTYTYTGLVNGDSSATFSGGLATNATSSSTVGVYPITQGNLAATGNYTIGIFNPGVLTVTKAMPTLTWPSPAAIPVAIALGNTQLDATANTAGIFTYTLADGETPASGAVLPIGANQILNLSFTPTDSADYAPATMQATINVVPHFVIAAPASTKAGRPFVFEVTALDQSNNTATGYTGTVAFTSSDPLATASGVLPDNTTLTNGVGFFATLLETAGPQTITVSDTSAGSIGGVSGSIAVSAAAATHFNLTAALPSFPGVVSGPTSFAVTGTGLPITVTALDQFNNYASNYGGTVSFSSSDTAAGVVLPATSPLTAGVGIFSATLQTAGNQVITASDISNPNFAGATSAIVTRGLVVTSFAPTPSGFTIAFDKPFNPSTALMYTAGSTKDDILLATTNSQVSVRGSAIFNASDTGFTFVKTDSISATGVFNPASGVLAAGNYTLTLRSLAGGNGFADALGVPLDGTDTGTGANYRITFSVSAPPVAVGIPDFARGPSNTDALFLPSMLTNGSTFSLSYTNPAANPTTGTATVTFSTTAATLQINIQAALSSGGLATQIGLNASANNTPNSVAIVTNDTSAGTNVLVTFQSALAQATNQLLSSSTAGVSIGQATINVANNIPGSGIPIGLSSGLGVTSSSFTLQYNPSLLTISGATAKAAGATFTLVSNTINSATSATAVLSLSSPTSLSSTAVPTIVGTLLATVPLPATSIYGAKQLLHFSSESLAGTAGPIAVTNADAVQVAAYLGDVTDLGGPLSLQDAGAIAAVAGTVANTAAQTIPGFAAFPNLDPAIIGDVSLQGSVNSTDTGAITQEIGGLARVTIPYAPIGLTVTPASPGPNSFVPAEPIAPAGSMVVVPVSPFVQARSSIRDLAAIQAQTDVSQPNSLSKDDLAYLWQTASQSLLSPGSGLLTDDAQTTEAIDGAGLDGAFSSGEATLTPQTKPVIAGNS